MMYKLSYLDDNGNTVATEPTWFASEGEALIQGVSSTYPEFPYNLYLEFVSKNCKRNLTKKFFSRKKMVERAEKHGGNILKIVEEMINL